MTSYRFRRQSQKADQNSRKSIGNFARDVPNPRDGERAQHAHPGDIHRLAEGIAEDVHLVPHAAQLLKLVQRADGRSPLPEERLGRYE